jgi:hypothetical protein
LFSSEMVESQSRVVELQELSWPGVKAIVDFAYTGTVALSGSTVVSIIQAANLLQVEAVEQAAVDFLVERLDAGNVLSAMALGAHYSAGAICRGLQEQSRAWVGKHFAQMAGEPSFLELSGTEVAGLVESDDVEAKEEEVFAAVMAWMKAEEEGRKAELDRLLPLVRFPLMQEPATAMMAEPLVRQHALIGELMFETHPDFAKSSQAASCPRLVPRKGTKPPLDLSWMCTTDAYQGFKKLTHFPTVALAVSQSNTYFEGSAYDAPAGWHWATAAEVEAVPGWGRKDGTYIYLSQGGWDGYRWEGVKRVRFAFRQAQALTADLSHYVNVAEFEGVVSAGNVFRSAFAGIVCIQD